MKSILQRALPGLLLCSMVLAAQADTPPASAKFGSLSYPAKGNIQLDEGTLDLWVISNFDTDSPLDKTPQGRNWRALLIALNFPEEKWKYVMQFIEWGNAFAMIGYCDPAQPYVWFGPPHWKAGEEHHVVFTWSGRKRSVFIDGICEWKANKGLNNARDVDAQGEIKGDLTAAQLTLGGGYSYVTIDEVQIRTVALTPEEIVKAKDAPLTADKYTLLLDHCDGGKAEIISGHSSETGGALVGTYEMVDGKFGKAIKLWKETQ